MSKWHRFVNGLLLGYLMLALWFAILVCGWNQRLLFWSVILPMFLLQQYLFRGITEKDFKDWFGER